MRRARYPRARDTALEQRVGQHGCLARGSPSLIRRRGPRIGVAERALPPGVRREWSRLPRAQPRTDQRSPRASVRPTPLLLSRVPPLAPAHLAPAEPFRNTEALDPRSE